MIKKTESDPQYIYASPEDVSEILNEQGISKKHPHYDFYTNYIANKLKGTWFVNPEEMREAILPFIPKTASLNLRKTARVIKQDLIRLYTQEAKGLYDEELEDEIISSFLSDLYIMGTAVTDDERREIITKMRSWLTSARTSQEKMLAIDRVINTAHEQGVYGEYLIEDVTPWVNDPFFTELGSLKISNSLNLRKTAEPETMQENFYEPGKSDEWPKGPKRPKQRFPFYNYPDEQGNIINIDPNYSNPMEYESTPGLHPQGPGIFGSLSMRKTAQSIEYLLKELDKFKITNLGDIRLFIYDIASKVNVSDHLINGLILDNMKRFPSSFIENWKVYVTDEYGLGTFTEKLAHEKIGEALGEWYRSFYKPEEEPSIKKDLSLETIAVPYAVFLNKYSPDEIWNIASGKKTDVTSEEIEQAKDVISRGIVASRLNMRKEAIITPSELKKLYELELEYRKGNFGVENQLNKLSEQIVKELIEFLEDWFELSNVGEERKEEFSEVIDRLKSCKQELESAFDIDSKMIAIDNTMNTMHVDYDIFEHLTMQYINYMERTHGEIPEKRQNYYRIWDSLRNFLKEQGKLTEKLFEKGEIIPEKEASTLNMREFEIDSLNQKEPLQPNLFSPSPEFIESLRLKKEKSKEEQEGKYKAFQKPFELKREKGLKETIRKNIEEQFIIPQQLKLRFDKTAQTEFKSGDEVEFNTTRYYGAPRKSPGGVLKGNGVIKKKNEDGTYDIEIKEVTNIAEDLKTVFKSGFVSPFFPDELKSTKKEVTKPLEKEIPVEEKPKPVEPKIEKVKPKEEVKKEVPPPVRFELEEEPTIEKEEKIPTEEFGEPEIVVPTAYTLEEKEKVEEKLEKPFWQQIVDEVWKGFTKPISLKKPLGSKKASILSHEIEFKGKHGDKIPTYTFLNYWETPNKTLILFNCDLCGGTITMTPEEVEANRFRIKGLPEEQKVVEKLSMKKIADDRVLWAIYEGEVYTTDTYYVDHIDWFEEIGLPIYGKEYDKVLRGYYAIDVHIIYCYEIYGTWTDLIDNLPKLVEKVKADPNTVKIYFAIENEIPRVFKYKDLFTNASFNLSMRKQAQQDLIPEEEIFVKDFVKQFEHLHDAEEIYEDLRNEKTFILDLIKHLKEDLKVLSDRSVFIAFAICDQLKEDFETLTSLRFGGNPKKYKGPVKSILEDIAQNIWNASDLTEAKDIVLNRVENSQIDAEDKQTIIRNVNRIKTLLNLQRYIANSILSYEGMGLKLSMRKTSRSDSEVINRALKHFKENLELSQTSKSIYDFILKSFPELSSWEIERLTEIILGILESNEPNVLVLGMRKKAEVFIEEFPSQEGSWVIYKGNVYITGNPGKRHAIWFEEIGLPSSGEEFDNIVRGYFYDYAFGRKDFKPEEKRIVWYGVGDYNEFYDYLEELKSALNFPLDAQVQMIDYTNQEIKVLAMRKVSQNKLTTNDLKRFYDLERKGLLTDEFVDEVISKLIYGAQDFIKGTIKQDIRLDIPYAERVKKDIKILGEAYNLPLNQKIIEVDQIIHIHHKDMMSEFMDESEDPNKVAKVLTDLFYGYQATLDYARLEIERLKSEGETPTAENILYNLEDSGYYNKRINKRVVKELLESGEIEKEASTLITKTFNYLRKLFSVPNPILEQLDYPHSWPRKKKKEKTASNKLSTSDLRRFYNLEAQGLLTRDFVDDVLSKLLYGLQKGKASLEDPALLEYMDEAVAELEKVATSRDLYKKIIAIDQVIHFLHSSLTFGVFQGDEDEIYDTLSSIEEQRLISEDIKIKQKGNCLNMRKTASTVSEPTPNEPLQGQQGEHPEGTTYFQGKDKWLERQPDQGFDIRFPEKVRIKRDPWLFEDNPVSQMMGSLNLRKKIALDPYYDFKRDLVPKYKMRNLYIQEAKGIYDEELMDEIIASFIVSLTNFYNWMGKEDPQAPKVKRLIEILETASMVTPEEKMIAIDQVLNATHTFGKYVDYLIRNGDEYFLEELSNLKVSSLNFKKKASILDYPQKHLDPEMWDLSGDLPKLKEDVKNLIIKRFVDYLKKEGLNNPEFWCKGFYYTGSTATYRYLKTSDIDIHVEIDWDIYKENNPNKAKDDNEEMRKDLLKVFWNTLNKEKLPETSHPLTYYILSAKENVLTQEEEVYDMINDKWIVSPQKMPENLDTEEKIKLLSDKAESIMKKLDEELGKTKRNLIDYKILRELVSSYEGDKEDLQKLVEKKLEDITQDLVQLQKENEQIHEERNKAFYDGQEPIEKGLSKNWTPGNIVFKLIERYRYLDILRKIKHVIKDDQVTETETKELEDVLIPKLSIRKTSFLPDNVSEMPENWISQDKTDNKKLRRINPPRHDKNDSIVEHNLDPHIDLASLSLRKKIAQNAESENSELIEGLSDSNKLSILELKQFYKLEKKSLLTDEFVDEVISKLIYGIEQEIKRASKNLRVEAPSFISNLKLCKGRLERSSLKPLNEKVIAIDWAIHYMHIGKGLGVFQGDYNEIWNTLESVGEKSELEESSKNLSMKKAFEGQPTTKNYNSPSLLLREDYGPSYLSEPAQAEVEDTANDDPWGESNKLKKRKVVREQGFPDFSIPYGSEGGEIKQI